MKSGEHVMVLAGTRDGLYLFESNCERTAWRQRGPYLAGYDVSHAVLDPRDGRTIWAAATGDGATGVYRSDDRGSTWRASGAPFDVDQVWHVEPGHVSQPWRVWAGVKPAALYRSDDGGESWQENAGLRDHPSRPEWWEGGAGLVLHTIVTHPEDPDDMFVGISVAGALRTTDGGKSWQPSNEGSWSMAAEWGQWNGTEAQHPGVHRCLHKMVRQPGNPAVLFQQNHMGVYRSDDSGSNWVDICDGLHDRFGFVIAAARDGGVYVVPQDMDKVRFSGQLTVYRTRDDGASWTPLTSGLPEVDNITLYREGMAADSCDPAGVYFGTSEGDLFHTSDGGEAWRKLAEGLPAVRSVSCEHFD